MFLCSFPLLVAAFHFAEFVGMLLLPSMLVGVDPLAVCGIVFASPFEVAVDA